MRDEYFVVDPVTRKIQNLDNMEKKVLRAYARKEDAKFPELQKQVIDYLGNEAPEIPKTDPNATYKPPWIK